MPLFPNTVLFLAVVLFFVQPSRFFVGQQLSGVVPCKRLDSRFSNFVVVPQHCFSRLRSVEYRGLVALATSFSVHLCSVLVFVLVMLCFHVAT
uniref:Secreted protein n=1 Tax=Ixodes ricinus TaxID=34613 RepID=A0A6B0UHD4_IXORI